MLANIERREKGQPSSAKRSGRRAAMSKRKIVRGGGLDAVTRDGAQRYPALHAIDRKARTVHSALAGFEFAVRRLRRAPVACALPALGADAFLTVCRSPYPRGTGKRRKFDIEPPLTGLAG
jgi:hypothetical protein